MNRLRKFIAKPSAGLRIRIHPTLQSEQIGVVPVEGACFIKVSVFYCLMKKFKSLNFYQIFLFTFLANLDQTHRDLLKITIKFFGKNLVI